MNNNSSGKLPAEIYRYNPVHSLKLLLKNVSSDK